MTAPPRGAVAGVGRQPVTVPDALVCVAAPALAVSDRAGQWRGDGIDGLYRDGRRLLARCVLRVAGTEPVTLQAGMLGPDRVRFVAVIRTAADRRPDPAVTVERVRSAGGDERVTLTNSGWSPLRLPVELSLGTDLAPLAEAVAGRAGRWLPCSVSGAGLRWSDGSRAVRTTARPASDVVVAASGMLSWRVELPPGASWTAELRTAAVTPARGCDAGPARPAPPPALWPDVELEADDTRAAALLGTALDDLQGLLLRDPAHHADLYLAAGAPWRLALAPQDALWSARMLLPLGTRLAAGTLRTLARTQESASGSIPRPAAGRGEVPAAGVLRGGGDTAVRHGARGGVALGNAGGDVASLLPAMERCMRWLRGVVEASGAGGLVADPVRGGPLRAEVQACAHRAALHGADLLEGFDRPGAQEWRERAARMREEFRRSFWSDGPGGGHPVVARGADGVPVEVVSSALAHLLDTGLAGVGAAAPGLLDREQATYLGRLLAAPDMDGGWGLRTLSAGVQGFSGFGHRDGAVRVHDTAVAAVRLAGAGREREAAALLTGVLDAAAGFGMRMPEIYAGDQRAAGRLPCPHPMACRPAALAAAGAVHLLAALVGVRPDVPGGSVALRPLTGAPAGAVRWSGIRVAQQPFAVRVGRLGTAMVEEAAAGLRLGA